jgi:hypothetical protein
MAASVQLSGPQLSAATIALQRFQQIETAPDISHFHIRVEETAEIFEVIFIPDPVEERDAKGARLIRRGGANIYGEEVHYVISRTTGEIIRTSFGR